MTRLALPLLLACLADGTDTQPSPTTRTALHGPTIGPASPTSTSSAARSATGTLAKASSVGAKTVNGPAPLSVPMRPAAGSAAARTFSIAD